MTSLDSLPENDETLAEQWDNYRRKLLIFANHLLEHPGDIALPGVADHWRQLCYEGEALHTDYRQYSDRFTSHDWAELGRLGEVIRYLRRRDLAACRGIIVDRDRAIQ